MNDRQRRFDRAIDEYLGPRRVLALDGFVIGFGDALGTSALRRAIEDDPAAPLQSAPMAHRLLEEGARPEDALFDELRLRIRRGLGQLPAGEAPIDSARSTAEQVDRVCRYRGMRMTEFSPEGLHWWLVGCAVARVAERSDGLWDLQWSAIEREMGRLDAPWYRVARVRWGALWAERVVLAARRMQTRATIGAGGAPGRVEAAEPRAGRDALERFRRFREQHLSARDPAIWDAYLQGFDWSGGPVFVTV